jgi:hypothetical protein
MELSGFSFEAGVDSKSLQSAFRKAIVVVSFDFSWASRKKPSRNPSYSSFVYSWGTLVTC